MLEESLLPSPAVMQLGGFLPETSSSSFSHPIAEALDTLHRTLLPPRMLLSGKCPVLLLGLC